MNLTLALIAVVILGSAGVAVSLRNLIHSALLLVVSWAGVAAFYLWAGAEFVAFAQVLVYVGGISMVVLFAVLLTRRSHVEIAIATPTASRVAAALMTGLAVFTVLAGAILIGNFGPPAQNAPSATVRELGLELMSTHGAAVLIIGTMLTVSLLGAVVLASSDSKQKGDSP